MIKRLVLFLSFIAVNTSHASSSWQEVVPAQKASAVCGDGEKLKAYASKNGQILICYFDGFTGANEKRYRPDFSNGKIKLQLSYSIGFKKKSQTDVNWIAQEGEMGAHPRTIDLSQDPPAIIESDPNGHRVLSSVISCLNSDCKLSEPKCILKSTSASQKAVAGLAAAMKKTKDTSRVWTEYFFDGKHEGDGGLVIDEAILGSRQALELTQTGAGTDAGPGEVAEDIQGDIGHFSRYCAPIKESKTHFGKRIIDCKSPHGRSEKTICASPVLKKLDDDVTSAFDRSEANEDRVEWYENLDSCKDDIGCIKKMYNDELFILKPSTSHQDSPK